MIKYKILMFVIMLFFSGFFSMTETAFLSLSRLRIHHLVDKKVKGADLIQRLKHDMHKLIIAILVGNNLVNVAASAIATSIALEISASWGISIATGSVTLILLVFGEVTPKSFAMLHKEKICLATAKLMRILMVLFYPLIIMLDWMSKKITKRDDNQRSLQITEEEVESIIKLGEEVGSIEKEEKEMIHNIFKFNDISVGEVMTPRTDMFRLNAGIKIADALEKVMSMKFSRIPVYNGETDNIIGIVHIRDILSAIVKNKKDDVLKDIMHDSYLVPDSKKIDDMLTEFQDKKIQMAVVIDEHGGVAGIVSIEDLLEEIVGEIYDEKDIKEHPIRKINKTTAIVRGKARIDEINKELGTRFRQNDSYDTISGMIMHKLEKIPKHGDKVSTGKYDIIVEKATKNKVLEVKIVKR